MKLTVYWMIEDKCLLGVTDFEEDALYTQVDALGNLTIGTCPYPNENPSGTIARFACASWISVVPKPTEFKEIK